MGKRFIGGGKEMNYKEISIIVPAYNEEKVIGDCINSLLEIDYLKDKYEIIIVNDGSTDKTKEIAEEYVKKHENIRLINKKNGGRGSALNVGLQDADGEFIVAIDADTFPKKDYLKEIIKPFRNKNVAVVTGCDYALKTETIVEKIHDARLVAMHRYSVPFKKYGIGTGTAFGKDLLISVGGFSESVISTTGTAVEKILNKGYLIEKAENAKMDVIVEKSFKQYLKQKLRWRELQITELSHNRGWQCARNLYVHGLSLLLFISIIGIGGSIISANYTYLYFFFLSTLCIFLIDGSRYVLSLIGMIQSKKDRKYAFYLILNVLFEGMVRFISIPYLLYLIIKPRKRPTFNAER